MEQLLQIQNIPISFEYKITHAKYEMTTDSSSVQIERDKGSLNIENKPTKIKMDSVDMRASMGLLTNTQLVKQYSQNGLQAAYEATGTAAQEGTMLMKSLPGQNVMKQITLQHLQSNVDVALAFTPSVPVDINWEKGNMSMQYQMDKLLFDWRTSGPKVEYTPAKIEYYISQSADTIVSYIGGPLYVPPSADPDYEENSFNISA